MIERDFTIRIAQPYLSLLEGEARASGRTVPEHVRHILGRRYDNLREVCQCGYYLYDPRDQAKCKECEDTCCPYCSIPMDEFDLCFNCAKAKGIPTEGKGGFKAMPNADRAPLDYDPASVTPPSGVGQAMAHSLMDFPKRDREKDS